MLVDGKLQRHVSATLHSTGRRWGSFSLAIVRAILLETEVHGAGIGGFGQGPLPPCTAESKAVVFTFGRNGFFSYTSASPADSPSLMWWSIFETAGTLLPPKTDLDPDETKGSLRKRHRTWTGLDPPSVRCLIHASHKPTRTRPSCTESSNPWLTELRKQFFITFTRSAILLGLHWVH